MTVEVAPPARTGRLKDGTSVLSAWNTPALPVRVRSAPEMTSIGVGLSVTVRAWPRERFEALAGALRADGWRVTVLDDSRRDLDALVCGVEKAREIASVGPLADVLAGIAEADELFGLQGEIIPLYHRTDEQLSVFVEHGLTRRLTLQAEAAYTRGEDMFSAYEGRGPTSLGLRYALIHTPRTVVSVYAGGVAAGTIDGRLYVFGGEQPWAAPEAPIAAAFPQLVAEHQGGAGDDEQGADHAEAPEVSAPTGVDVVSVSKRSCRVATASMPTRSEPSGFA